MLQAKHIDDRYANKLQGNTARADFFALHFPSHENHRMNGNVILKAGASYNWKTIRFSRSGSHIHEYARHMFVQKQDYYTTINTFSGCSSDNEHLFGLCNIYADLDCPELHENESALNTDQFTRLCNLYDNIIGAIYDAYPDDLPMPNTIVCTGRGIGVWWAFDQISYKLMPLYDAVRNKLLREFYKWLHSTSVCDIAGLTLELDSSASKRASGLARLPGTYNAVAKRWGFFNIIHTCRNDMFSVAYDLGIGYIHSSGTNITTIPHGGAISALMYGNRLDMLNHIRDIRVAEGTLRGHRDEMLYCFYNTLRALMPNDESWVMQATLEYNNSFREYAFSERRVYTYMSSSRKKAYPLSDVETINRIGMTEMEALQTGWDTIFKRFVAPSTTNNEGQTDDGALSFLSTRQKAKAKRIEKQNRNKEIIELYKTGESQSTLARKFGINRSTVYRIIKAWEETKTETQQNHPTEEDHTQQSATVTNIHDWNRTVASKNARKYNANKCVAKNRNESIFKNCSISIASKIAYDNPSRYEFTEVDVWTPWTDDTS